ncbi:MAG: DUF362 domain-containing protein [Planctomycetaceae bacterium]|nr:DUF362 domain-containing protein [Planctomycetaceae bacterium]
MSESPRPHPPAWQRLLNTSLSRRSLLLSTTSAVASALGCDIVNKLRAPKQAKKAPVFIARNQRYDGPLEQTIRDGLLASGLDPARLKGKKVLLKPNMVEPTRLSPQMTTHPAVVLATAEVFRKWDCTVSVGEAPGHVRDTEMALSESRLGDALDSAKLPFADLNYEEVGWRDNKLKVSPLPGLFFPRSVLEADLVVSMPKLKTHHWVGITASLKNMYGTLPGIKYGWPKNVLHHAGIPQTVIDINGALPPTVAVVDGITCMEGDGPILGSAKEMGIIGVGANLTALDATLARIMGLVPQRISYLILAEQKLGPLSDRLIQQRGERWQELVSPFQVMDREALKFLQMRDRGELES